jgi:hypothetical protein
MVTLTEEAGSVFLPLGLGVELKAAIGSREGIKR